MAAFWMMLGGAAGIKVLQTAWHLLGWDAGRLSVAVPVGGLLGAAGAALVGRVSNPRVLVLLMAVFAGSAAGGVAGGLAWGGSVRSPVRSSAGRSLGLPGRPGCPSAAGGTAPSEPGATRQGRGSATPYRGEVPWPSHCGW
jgi:hypothetical protein